MGMKNSATKHDANEPNDSPKEDLQNLADYIETSIKLGNEWKRVQGCIISAVNPLLRKGKEDNYRSKFVIIGPLRFYEEVLRNMEMRKRVYLDSFLHRARKATGATLVDLCQLVKQSSRRISECYEEKNYRCYDFKEGKFRQNLLPNDANSKYFVEMILVDACFIIELMLESFWEESELGTNSGIRRDLFLVHNQLPLFILKDIYERATGENKHFPPFLRLTCHFFGHYYSQNTPIDDIWANNVHAEYRFKLESAKHFTDLLRTLQLPNPSHQNCSSKRSLWSKLFSSCKKQRKDLESGKVGGEYLYGAILLREAGVRFRASSSKCLLEIEFNKSNGHLKIPPLRLDEWTEDFLRNLMAWEQKFYPDQTDICDYIFFLKYLITSTQDVDLLVRRRIIISELGSHEAVVTLFKDIGMYINLQRKSRSTDILVELNAYHVVRSHGWYANLRLQYFSTLWKGVATFAAIILLVLTLIQTICSVIQLHGGT